MNIIKEFKSCPDLTGEEIYCGTLNTVVIGNIVYHICYKCIKIKNPSLNKFANIKVLRKMIWYEIPILLFILYRLRFRKFNNYLKYHNKIDSMWYKMNNKGEI